MKLKSALKLCAVPLLLLTSCASSTPKKGLDIWLKDVNDYYAELGLKNAISVNYANYAWIKGDGTIEAGSLKGTVWYLINYTLKSSSASGTFTTYALYQNGHTSELNDSLSYTYAVQLVNDGSLKGETGRL